MFVILQFDVVWFSAGFAQRGLGRVQIWRNQHNGFSAFGPGKAGNPTGC